ncbi:DUF4760 domain-containing protein [Actinomadura scrupuli]|uniref:DUF4760 domain-containing protein n=1 Tax=Actinomadura scrupuli TaxID=559629 RepID=UPI003D98230F
MIFNVVATVLSLAAFLSSTYIALEHRVLQKRANFIPAYMQVLDEFRTMEFHDNYRYVTTRLRVEHDPQLGISGLPEEARRAVYDIAYFYQGVGMLRLQQVLDDETLPTMRVRTIRVWEAVAPYVERERELQGLGEIHLLRILEEFAKKAREQPSALAGGLLTRRRFVKIQNRLGRADAGER